VRDQVAERVWTFAHRRTALWEGLLTYLLTDLLTYLLTYSRLYGRHERAPTTLWLCALSEVSKSTTLCLCALSALTYLLKYLLTYDPLALRSICAPRPSALYGCGWPLAQLLPQHCSARNFLAPCCSHITAPLAACTLPHQKYMYVTSSEVHLRTQYIRCYLLTCPRTHFTSLSS